MRLFHSLSVENLTEKTSTSPFLTNREKDARISLLNDIKERKQRVPTPEKKAILQLASSFEKRRLGKQQQILAGIAQRCREQEVNDLSEVMSAKCDLMSPRRGARTTTGTETPFYMTRPNNRDRVSDAMSDSLFYAGTTPMERRDENYHEKHTFFPARRIIRQQSKLAPLSDVHPGSLFYDHNKTRPSEDNVNTLDSPKTSQKSHHLLESNHRSTGDNAKNFNPLQEKVDAQAPSRLSYVQLGTSSYFTPHSGAGLHSVNQDIPPPVLMSNPAFTDSHVGFRQHLRGSLRQKTLGRFHKLNISSEKVVPNLLSKSLRDIVGPKIPSLQSLGMAISDSVESPRS